MNLYTFANDADGCAGVVDAVRHLAPGVGGDGQDGLVDCAHFVRLAHAAAGIVYDIPTIHEIEWWRTRPRLMVDYYTLHLRWRRVSVVQANDVLLFSMICRDGDHPAVYLGNGSFLHMTKDGMQINAIDDTMWMTRLVCVLRPK